MGSLRRRASWRHARATGRPVATAVASRASCCHRWSYLHPQRPPHGRHSRSGAKLLSLNPGRGVSSISHRRSGAAPLSVPDIRGGDSGGSACPDSTERPGEPGLGCSAGRPPAGPGENAAGHPEIKEKSLGAPRADSPSITRHTRLSKSSSSCPRSLTTRGPWTRWWHCVEKSA